MTQLVVLGAEGMLGQALSKGLSHYSPRAGGRVHADVTSNESLRNFIPERATVINCSGYTNVDRAESDEAAAFAINADAVSQLAQIIKDKGGKLIHVSTDYVFDGSSITPYGENSICSPQTAYGRSKAQGERAVKEILPDTGIILRVAWLYGYPGKSFPSAILRASQVREFLDVVTDQVGQPTWTGDVARMVESLVANDIAHGVFHATNSGQTSWHGFAQSIFRHAGLGEHRIRPTISEAFPRPAPRPSYSVLGHEAWGAHGLPEPRSWEDALAEAWTEELQHVLGEQAR